MNKFPFFFVLYINLLVLASCKKETPNTAPEGSLQFLINENKMVDKSSVIACATSSRTSTNDVNVFFYPRVGTTDYRYFETVNTTANALDYSEYKEFTPATENVFNGYLKKFIRKKIIEKWVIISFMEKGRLQFSDPIRLKHKTKSTLYSTSVTIDTTTELQPIFTWSDEGIKDNIIYFEVVSDSSNQLLSGTYTDENKFQYYNTNNLILNVTRNTPPALQYNSSYRFTMMGVSDDNWVNLVIEKGFGF